MMKVKGVSRNTLDILFRISRVLGTAPVKFTLNGLQLSRPLKIWSNLFFTTLNCMLVFGTIIDFSVERSRSIRVPTISSYLIWITNLTIVMLINASGVYFQPARIKCISDVLSQLNKIKKMVNFNNNNSLSPNNKSRTTIICLLASIVVLIICDTYKYAESAINLNKEVRVLILYSSFYYQFLCVLLFECQFIAIAFEVQSMLISITKNLNDLLSIVETKQLTTNGKLSTENIHFPKAVTNIKRINDYIDNLATVIAVTEKNPEGLERILRNLAVAYGYTCDMVRELNSGFGLQLLLILMSFCMQLVVTPYYLIIAVYTSSHDVFLLLLQVTWCVYHMMNMWCVVEPAYLTQVEVEKTEVLIRRFFCHVKPYDPLYTELDMFSRQLAFTPPSYSPLGVCTLSRQLCLNVLGAVTTYLVIILQFRANEK